jgi:hypothetical protein
LLAQTVATVTQKKPKVAKSKMVGSPLTPFQETQIAARASRLIALTAVRTKSEANLVVKAIAVELALTSPCPKNPPANAKTKVAATKQNAKTANSLALYTKKESRLALFFLGAGSELAMQ